MCHGFVQVTEPRFTQPDQSWVYQGEFKHTASGKVVRVIIRRNAYDAQSYKRVCIFDLQSGQWHVLASEPLTAKDSCHRISYTKISLDKYDRADFVKDALAALVVPMQILYAAMPEIA